MRRSFGLLVAVLLTCCLGGARRRRGRCLEIEVVSNRADLISAGDALVAVDLPDGVDPATVNVRAGDRDVTDAFAVRANGRFEGLVDRPRAGRQRPHRRAARRPGRALDDHQPPQRRAGLLRARRCSRGSARPTAVDEQCNQPPSYTVPVQVLGHRGSSRPTTRPARRPTSPRRPPTRADRSRSSSGPRPATRTATSTRSRSSTTRRSRGQPWEPAGRSGTTSC